MRLPLQFDAPVNIVPSGNRTGHMRHIQCRMPAAVRQRPWYSGTPAAVARRSTDDLTANTRVRMTAGSSIDYDALTQEALRGVVRKILTQVLAKGGLPGEHHFYIAFDTQAPGVVLSRRLKEKYPEEMMIVLQHRFWDLAVTEEGFEVKLTFDGIPERLCIPFEALRVFFDPSVRYTLQFGEAAAGEDTQDGARRRGETGPRQAGDRRARTRAVRSRQENGAELSPAAAVVAPQASAPASGGAATPVPTAPTVFAPRPVAAVPASQEVAASDTPAKEGAKVFSLDQFRKK